MTINKLPRQLPYSHDVSVSVNGGRPGTAYAPCALRIMLLLVGLAKCGHVTKTFLVCERHDNFITGIPRKLDHMWCVASIYSPYTVRQCL